MAEAHSNGLADVDMDVEMKEEDDTSHSTSTIIGAPPGEPDLTDPLPDPLQQDHSLAQSLEVEPTPTSATNGSAQTSHVQFAVTNPSVAALAIPTRASSTPQPIARPEKPVAHGGPTRQYLNANVTPHLLEAMKYLAVHEPEKPLLWLSDFLRDRSKEIEGA